MTVGNRANDRDGVICAHCLFDCLGTLQ
jgi:hypothetical protein